MGGRCVSSRIASMRSRHAGAVRADMERLAGTRALIIDVRGNRGGGRRILLELLPRFLPPGIAPRVVNAARLRAPRPGDAGALADRFMYPRKDARWSPTQQAAIDAHPAASTRGGTWP